MKNFLLQKNLHSLNGWQRIFLFIACIYAIFLFVNFKIPESDLSLSAAVSQNLPAPDGIHYMAIVLSDGKGIRLGETYKFRSSDSIDKRKFLMSDGVVIVTEENLTQEQVQAAYKLGQIDQKYRYVKTLLFAMAECLLRWFISLLAIYFLCSFLAWVYKGFRAT